VVWKVLGPRVAFSIGAVLALASAAALLVFRGKMGISEKRP
jgi:hypothetical protein